MKVCGTRTWAERSLKNFYERSYPETSIHTSLPGYSKETRMVNMPLFDLQEMTEALLY